MYVIEFLALVDLLEVSTVCVTALAIVGIMVKFGRRKGKGCGCEFCGADEHKEDSESKKE